MTGREGGGARHRWAAPLLAVLAVPVLALGLTGCEPTGPRVLILGDSLTSEVRASPDAAYWMAQLGDRLDWSGTEFMSAPCNGLRALSRLGYAPDVVVINYVGNHGSFVDNCMAGENGQALVDRYVRDVRAIVAAVHNRHTKVVIVGAPARQDVYATGNAIFDALSGYARVHHVSFVDGGRYLTPGRLLYREAACLPRETGRRCGTAGVPGRNIIRDQYLDHLCPGPIDVYGRCDSYSSGAVRLAVQLVTAIRSAAIPQLIGRA